MKFVEDAKDCWKWFSMQAMVVATALQGTWVVLPEDLKSDVPKNIVQWVTMGLLVLGAVGRLVPQEPKDAAK